MLIVEYVESRWIKMNQVRKVVRSYKVRWRLHAAGLNVWQGRSIRKSGHGTVHKSPAQRNVEKSHWNLSNPVFASARRPRLTEPRDAMAMEFRRPIRRSRTSLKHGWNMCWNMCWNMLKSSNSNMDRMNETMWNFSNLKAYDCKENIARLQQSIFRARQRHWLQQNCKSTSLAAKCQRLRASCDSLHWHLPAPEHGMVIHWRSGVEDQWLIAVYNSWCESSRKETERVETSMRIYRDGCRWWTEMAVHLLDGTK